MCYDLTTVAIGFAAAMISGTGFQPALIGSIVMSLSLGPAITADGKISECPYSEISKTDFFCLYSKTLKCDVLKSRYYSDLELNGNLKKNQFTGFFEMPFLPSYSDNYASSSF